MGATGLPTVERRQSAAHPSFPYQDPELVRGVVGAAHANFDRVKELVEAYPELAKSSWDWGFGDWESALGAAAHTGRREIALLLLEHGARPTLFSAAMLGQVDVVRALVQAQPGVQGTPGPHGITLLSHARAGREHADSVVAYLEEVGGADPARQSAPLATGDPEALLGFYRFGEAADERIEVTDRDGTPFLAREGGVARGLTHQGNRSFTPAGAPSVRITFEGSGPPARVRIHMGGVEVVGEREG